MENNNEPISSAGEGVCQVCYETKDGLSISLPPLNGHYCWPCFKRAIKARYDLNGRKAPKPAVKRNSKKKPKDNDKPKLATSLAEGKSNG